MIFLLLSITCSVIIAHLFKYAEEQAIPMFGLFAVNYLVGSCVAFWGCSPGFRQQLSSPLLILGALVGVLFVCSYVLMVLSMKKLGVTIPVSLMRLSAVFPTFGSMVFFAEIPEPLQVLGITLAFLSLPLASQDKLLLKSIPEIFHNGFGWGLMLFVVFGITNFAFKMQRELISLSNPYHFLVIIFPAAFLVSGIMVLRQKIVFTKIIVGLGIILGIINLFSSYFFMEALQSFSGIVVYPINGIGIILGSALTSIFLWKERLTGTNYIFIALASVALLMIYPH
ncbi:MAG: DMT family transporter [bacterium]|nr:DMT family transporter [bacterium]